MGFTRSMKRPFSHYYHTDAGNEREEGGGKTGAKREDKSNAQGLM